MDERTEDLWTQEFWDERYQSRGALWSGNPNPQLVVDVADLPPGRALDVGCGEGADALWLAERGWHVTAVDVSRIALERGAAHAARKGDAIMQRIAWLHADMRDWPLPQRSYDLVSAQFVLHLPQAPRDAVFRGLAAAVAPGGSVLVVNHHPLDLQIPGLRFPRPDLFWRPSAIAALLDPNEWEIMVSKARERSATDAHGHPITIHDAVLRARRHA